jgi:hypothetical protein
LINKKGISMKKMVIILAIALASNTSNAFQCNQLAQKENIQKYNTNRFDDEYNNNYADQHDIDEYDQYVCDDVQSPKVSKAEALLKEMLSFVLVRCIAMREIGTVYFKELKDLVNKWLSVWVKA